MVLIISLVSARPSYGYCRITALLNRQLRNKELLPVNHKWAYCIMHINNLLLAGKCPERSGHTHDRKVEIMRSNLRWCGDRFELSSWTADIIRDAFKIDATTVISSRGALSQMSELAGRVCAI